MVLHFFNMFCVLAIVVKTSIEGMDGSFRVRTPMHDESRKFWMTCVDISVSLMIEFYLSFCFECQLFPLMIYSLFLKNFTVALQESFDPIVDAVTGRDLIPTMVYG